MASLISSLIGRVSFLSRLLAVASGDLSPYTESCSIADSIDLRISLKEQPGRAFLYCSVVNLLTFGSCYIKW